MDREIVRTESAPAAIGPYSQAVKAGGLVFTAGQIALDAASGEIVGGGDVARETAQVMENLRSVLEAAGSGLDRTVRCEIYLADLADFAVVNGVYGRYFPAEPPARVTVEVARLPRDVRVEIAAIAVADHTASP